MRFCYEYLRIPAWILSEELNVGSYLFAFRIFDIYSQPPLFPILFAETHDVMPLVFQLGLCVHPIIASAPIVDYPFFGVLDY